MPPRRSPRVIRAPDSATAHATAHNPASKCPSALPSPGAGVQAAPAPGNRGLSRTPSSPQKPGTRWHSSTPRRRQVRTRQPRHKAVAPSALDHATSSPRSGGGGDGRRGRGLGPRASGEGLARGARACPVALRFGRLWEDWSAGMSSTRTWPTVKSGRDSYRTVQAAAWTLRRPS